MNADKILVTEDSDYGVHGEVEYQKVYTYMKDEMGLVVFTGHKFLNCKESNSWNPVQAKIPALPGFQEF